VKIALDWSPGCRLIPEAAAKDSAASPAQTARAMSRPVIISSLILFGWGALYSRAIFLSGHPPPTGTASPPKRRVAVRAAFSSTAFGG